MEELTRAHGNRGRRYCTWLLTIVLLFAFAPALAQQKSAKPQVRPTTIFQSVQALERKIKAIKVAEKGREQTDRNQKNIHPSLRKEAPGLDYLEAYHFYLQQRAYPNDTVNWKAYPEAVAHSILMPPAQMTPPNRLTPNVLGGSWQFVGPRGLTIPYRIYYGVGPLNGRVNALKYAPQDPNTYYLGAARGGLWRSTDRGTTWNCLSDQWEGQEVNSIALHPTNPKIIYVGTGDFHGYGGYPYGLMKSTNGGATWVNLGRSQFGRFAVSEIALDPENPSIVTVTTGRGQDWWGKVWRSTNGGATWNVVINTDASWSEVEIGALNTSNNRRYYYAVGHYNGGQVWRSADRGATWTKLTTPLSNNNWWEQECVEIAASPTQPDVVYLMTGFDRKIYRSANAGASWSDITSGFPNGNTTLGATYNWSQYFYDAHLTCARRTDITGVNSDVLYAGLIDLAQYRHNGTSWVWQSLGGPTYVNASLLHNDQHCMAVNPQNPNETLVGCDGGVYRLTYNPGSNTWNYVSLNAPGGITQFYKMAAHPTNINHIMGGTQDNATPASRGNLNAWSNVGGGDGGFCEINPNDTNHQYATAQFLAIYRTTNNWTNTSYISPGTGSDRIAFIAPILLDPTNTNRLYAATNYLYRYNASTGAWTARLGSQQLSVDGEVLIIAVAPTDGNRIYTGSSRGELWMTTDGGTTWTQINTGTISLPDRVITAINVHPTNPSEILVGVSGTGTGHLWRCTNTLAGATRTWQNRSGSGATALPDIPLNAIVRDPDSVNTLYVGTDVGVFRSTNMGGNWSNATGALGMPIMHVNDLKVVAATRSLYAATYARGIWRLSLPTSAYSVSGTVSLNGIANNAYPLTFEFRPSTGTTFQRIITPNANGTFTAGDIPPGTYALAIKGPKWLRETVTGITITNANVTGVSTTLKAGDINDDNIVDLFDLILFFESYGAAPNSNSWNDLADFTGDSVIDLFDLILFFENYGQAGDA